MDLDANRNLVIAALSRIAGGERTALQTVYRLTSAKLFAVVLRILGSREEAEDVLQDVYLTVWRRAADFDPSRASPMTWLITIARNRAIDRLRATRGTTSFEALDAANAIADDAPGAEQLLTAHEDQARLRTCLDSLATEESTALRGAFFAGSTYEELARRGGIPAGTMKSRIRRALMKMKLCLEAAATR
ncbi:sigma-70 family RNA polymerase sigma factor [Undibacter mobilis]|uniref:RNA polymerase sigma factor n=1 Tax=Undibacter mobilis TaxID=2292256 RepID=A0A371B6J4_9BRAD|nr:sigma-70 family RNA polymerase sigma factor [Undibacter mobilis]RDV03198.1 RNA polymerase subunit sigma [Undibacter mobilis]